MAKRITPINNHGNIQLKWTFQGHRYTLHPIPGARYDDPLDLAKVEALAEQIALDIRRDCFDITLERYRPTTPKTSKPEGEPPRIDSPLTLLDLWDRWVDTLNLSEETKAGHYEYVRCMITKATPAVDDAEWFVTNGSSLAASTYNKRLGYLRRCLDWGVKSGLTVSNAYDLIRTKPVRKKVVKPFTIEEIHQILEYFQEHHPTYTPFVSFLFMTGCRPSEAIGLQWKRVNFGRGEVTIEDSLPISNVTGKPRRKGTKTDSVTVLDMTPELRDLLTGLHSEAVAHGRGIEADDLIFYSPEGCTIHRSNFWGIWSRVLKQLGIPHRKPYTTRHTMASHAIEQGTPLTGVAYLLGHRDTRMVSQTYGHMVNRPTLPKLTLNHR